MEDGFAFQLHIINFYAESFNNQTFGRIELLRKVITIHLILFFNLYQLKGRLKTSTLIG